MLSMESTTRARSPPWGPPKTFSRSCVCALASVCLAADACIIREDGTAVELTAGGTDASLARAELITDLGYDVALEKLYVVLGGVELVPCAAAEHASIFRMLVGPSIAHAHGIDSSTAWHAAVALAPTVGAGTNAVATLHPPATDYCSVRLTLAAADDSVAWTAPDPELVGRSLLVQGSFKLAASEPRQDFKYVSANSSTRVVTLVDGSGDPAVLSLSEHHLRVTLRIELAYERMFDGLALLPGAFAPVGDAVLNGVLDHAAVVVLDDQG